MTAVLIFLFGLVFGSFVNALVWRLHQQSISKRSSNNKLSVTKGRSMCPNCKHQLAAQDLIPLVSWLYLRGRCRYCNKRISVQYPIVEIVLATLFLVSYLFWPYEFTVWTISALVLWLSSLVILMALLVYDLKWMLLPNKLIFPLYPLAGFYALALAFFEKSFESLLSTLIGVAIGGGIFYVLFQISEGRWIGGGDVKLGFALGAFVGGPVNAVLMLFVASLMGSLAALTLLVAGRPIRNTRIPFGPFLISAAYICVLWGQKMYDTYMSYVLGV